MVIPATRNDSFLHSAINSALSQTYSPSRVLVVLSGVTEAVSPLRDADDLQVLSFSERLGVARARNIGTEGCADCDLIAVLDADDVAAPGRLEAQVQAFEASPTLDVVATSVRVIDSRGEALGRRSLGRVSDQQLKQRLVHANPFVHSSVVIRRSTLAAVGGYSEQCSRSVDYDLWLRLALAGAEFAYLPEDLTDYRLHQGQISRRRSHSVAHVRKVAVSKFRLAREVEVSQWAATTSTIMWSVKRLAIDAGLVTPRLDRGLQRLDE